MANCKIECRSQSGIGNRCQITFNQPIHMCYKNKAFLHHQLESSGTYLTRNVSPCLFFIKEENEKVFGTLKLLKYKASPIPYGRLEVPFSLTFSCKEKWFVDTIEEFIQNFYTFEYTETSQLTPAIARTRKRMILKLLFLNQKMRKMRRGKNVNQTKFI